MYPTLYAILTLFFTWFYNEITLKPDEMAGNLNKSAGFVLGVRPGEATVEYFEKIILKNIYGWWCICCIISNNTSINRNV